MDETKTPQPITTWLESVCSSANHGREISPIETKIRQGKDEAILAVLAKLSLHYWRPDFTPKQAKQLYGDYVHDLSQFAFSDINRAIEKYRQDGANRFFPTIGAIIDLIIGKAEYEADNPGAPDRHKTLAWSRNRAIQSGFDELQAMIENAGPPRLKAPVTQPIEAHEYVPRESSGPIARDLPPHPGVRQPRYVPGANE